MNGNGAAAGGGPRGRGARAARRDDPRAGAELRLFHDPAAEGREAAAARGPVPGVLRERERAEEAGGGDVGVVARVLRDWTVVRDVGIPGSRWNPIYEVTREWSGYAVLCDACRDARIAAGWSVKERGLRPGSLAPQECSDCVLNRQRPIS